MELLLIVIMIGMPMTILLFDYMRKDSHTISDVEVQGPYVGVINSLPQNHDGVTYYVVKILKNANDRNDGYNLMTALCTDGRKLEEGQEVLVYHHRFPLGNFAAWQSVYFIQ